MPNNNNTAKIALMKTSGRVNREIGHSQREENIDGAA